MRKRLLPAAWGETLGRHKNRSITLQNARLGGEAASCAARYSGISGLGDDRPASPWRAQRNVLIRCNGALRQRHFSPHWEVWACPRNPLQEGRKERDSSSSSAGGGGADPAHEWLPRIMTTCSNCSSLGTPVRIEPDPLLRPGTQFSVPALLCCASSWSLPCPSPVSSLPATLQAVFRSMFFNPLFCFPLISPCQPVWRLTFTVISPRLARTQLLAFEPTPRSQFFLFGACLCDVCAVSSQ